jgi:hypothetical protein
MLFAEHGVYLFRLYKNTMFGVVCVDKVEIRSEPGNVLYYQQYYYCFINIYCIRYKKMCT